jgi:hypothetical protein
VCEEQQRRQLLVGTGDRGEEIALPREARWDHDPDPVGGMTRGREPRGHLLRGERAVAGGERRVGFHQFAIDLAKPCLVRAGGVGERVSGVRLHRCRSQKHAASTPPGHGRHAPGEAAARAAIDVHWSSPPQARAA